MAPLRFKPEQVNAALIEAKGMVTHAARILNCPPQTVQNYINRYSSLRETLKWEREKMTDVAESGLYKAIAADNFSAIAFYLRTVGRVRGYVEKSELDVTDSSKVRIVIEEPPSA